MPHCAPLCPIGCAALRFCRPHQVSNFTLTIGIVLWREFSPEAICRWFKFGKMRLTLESGAELEVKALLSSNPYVKLGVGRLGSFVSGVAYSTAYPVWSETYEVSATLAELIR